MWMKSFTHESIGLLETIFSSSKSMLLYLQYGKELFASWSCHTILTGLRDLDPSPNDHPWFILDQRVHDRIPSQPPQCPNPNRSGLSNDNTFHKGWGKTPGFCKACTKAQNALIKVAVIQIMTCNIYFVIITSSSLYFQKPMHLGDLFNKHEYIIKAQQFYTNL